MRATMRLEDVIRDPSPSSPITPGYAPDAAQIAVGSAGVSASWTSSAAAEPGPTVSAG
jgi:hypothetical protein